MSERANEKRRATRRRPGEERLLEAASDLFYREGIRAVGVDTISEKANVSKRTLYNRFGGKDELVAEYLRHRDKRWRIYLREATATEGDPKSGILAVFAAYKEWMVRGELRGCPFTNAVAEIPDPAHPARIVARQHKDGIREHLAALTREAGYGEPEELAERLLLLLEGATATTALRHSGEPLEVARSTALELLDARSC